MEVFHRFLAEKTKRPDWKYAGLSRWERAKEWAVRTCVIFNPVAKGNKARRFRRHIDAFGSQCALKMTAAAGDARRLAAAAVEEGFEVVVAAGGDGTVNEVLNGLGDAPQGFEKACLGVLPLGTVNVFARELGLALRLRQDWEIIMRGREARVDLPWADFTEDGKPQRRYFAQLAGAGLDARAIELVSWELKKKVGPLAYVIAGLEALKEKSPEITAGGKQAAKTGGLVLIGNGRLYGGHYRVFPTANLGSGRLDVCAFPRVNWLTLAKCGPSLLLRGVLPSSCVERFEAESFTLTSATRTPFELDGELVGHLPATFSVRRAGLRVIVP
jgi:YegS/Rv2252/BmrU family lipid kinase